jgi:lysyl-tRNA synthetase class 2
MKSAVSTLEMAPTSAASANTVNKAELIKARAGLLSRARAFLSSRGLIETDVPVLVSGAPLDDHIDLFEVPVSGSSSQGCRFLHSSPEYGMKRLLAAGCPDLFQISHVFRKGERGRNHNPEFLMAEWYRIGWTLDQLIEETAAFIQTFVGGGPVFQSGYWDLLKDACGQELSTASTQQLLEVARGCGLELSEKASQLDTTALVQLLFATQVEPHLGQQGLQVVRDFPQDQAALARLVERNGRRVAQRFEIYDRGLELCNGYDELSDAQEQMRRFHESNQLRKERGLEAYPVDEKLLKSLPQLPRCAGVAVGLDRVFQLALGAGSLAEVLPWSWEDC